MAIFFFHDEQGVRPQSFDKVENAEIREIIDRCTRLRKEDRPSVKDLLNHEFFAEDTGLKVLFLAHLPRSPSTCSGDGT